MIIQFMKEVNGTGFEGSVHNVIMQRQGTEATNDVPS